jgi:hypothetical protein
MGRFPGRGPTVQCRATHYCSGQWPTCMVGSRPWLQWRPMAALSHAVQSGTALAARGCGQAMLGGGPWRGARQGIGRRTDGRERRDRGWPHRWRSLVGRNGEQERWWRTETTAHGGTTHLVRLSSSTASTASGGDGDR